MGVTIEPMGCGTLAAGLDMFEAGGAADRITIPVPSYLVRHPDGIAVIEWVRETTPGLPVLVMSGHATVDSTISALRLGAYDYLLKPFGLDEIERTIEAASAHELQRLERGLSVLATVSNIAPLLGFLGTVSGMINSFDALARAGLSNPGLVAKGISEALITTATGLAVAIPMLVAYNYFTSRVSKFVLEMETSANVLLETYSEMEETGGGAA